MTCNSNCRHRGSRATNSCELFATRNRHAMSQFGSVGFVVCGIALAAIGSSAEMRAADKRSYSLFNPTPDHLLRDLSTDRPDKTESPYTVDAGRIQIETDLVAYTHDRQDGITTRAFDVLPFNLKIGLTS